MNTTARINDKFIKLAVSLSDVKKLLNSYSAFSLKITKNVREDLPETLKQRIHYLPH